MGEIRDEKGKNGRMKHYNIRTIEIIGFIL